MSETKLDKPLSDNSFLKIDICEFGGQYYQLQCNEKTKEQILEGQEALKKLDKVTKRYRHFLKSGIKLCLKNSDTKGVEFLGKILVEFEKIKNEDSGDSKN